MLGSLTVYHKNGQSFAAQNLQVLRKGWGSGYAQCMLVFECSGVLTSFPVEDIKDIGLSVREMPSPPLPASVG